MQYIILQSNVRISLVHPREGNTGLQNEPRYYRSSKRIYSSKLIVYAQNLHNLISLT
jgi:hypothetical protein